MRFRRPFIVVAALLAFGSCTVPSPPSGLYDWGSYDTSVQHLYIEGGTKHLIEDRAKLIDEVRKTQLKGKQRVPPGKYAQIGYLSWMAGDTAMARQYFTAERDAYPESAHFMDALIARLQ